MFDITEAACAILNFLYNYNYSLLIAIYTGGKLRCLYSDEIVVMLHNDKVKKKKKKSRWMYNSNCFEVC